MPQPTPTTVYSGLLDQISDDCAVLFLGAGSTRNCKDPAGKKGLTGDELAQEILAQLDPSAVGTIKVSLTEAAEYFVANKASTRAGLDKFIQKRLTNLQPSIGHYLAASFNWRAVITTNYNAVVESAWATAHANGFVAKPMTSIRSDADLEQQTSSGSLVRLYKPHGCITVKEQKEHRMVITSQDYFMSDQIRPKMYEVIRSLARESTTLFIGYSMADYTFRNIYYDLFAQRGEWTMRSFSVAPETNDLKFSWMCTNFDKFFNTTLINDGFDTFMLRLTLARGTLHPTLKQMLADRWDDISSTSAMWMEGLELDTFIALPEP